MQRHIGVRELKNQTSEVVRAVREEAAEYVITFHGQPVAVLRPYEEADAKKQRQEVIKKHLAEMEALAKAIGEAWTSPRSALEILEEIRNS